MAKSKPTKNAPPHTKLPKLEANQKISKRPLLHPPITSSLLSASSPKIIYISTSTPFISTIKRVQAQLDAITSRCTGPLNFKSSTQVLKAVNKSMEQGNGKREEEIIMKATGRAVEKLLRLCLYFQQKEGVHVRVRTGSVGAIDDIVEGGEETGESRVRRTSCLEVGVRLC